MFWHVVSSTQMAKKKFPSITRKYFHSYTIALNRTKKGMTDTDEETAKMYHEHQTMALCALHALNNLFQGVAFTREQLDEICKRLSPESGIWNPHRSFIGLGNYDINVIMTALQSKDCCAHWFDKRKDPSIIDLSQVVGFILNVPSDAKIGRLTIPYIRRKHWITVRQVDGVYYNFDSKLDNPEAVGDETALMSFLRIALQCKDKELFVVISMQVDETSSWIKTSQPQHTASGGM